MTTTDEFRHLLDERGVEWDYGITGAASTKFNANGVELTFIDMRDGVTCSTILTPEQAIAATLGPRSDSCNCTNGERTNLAVTLGDADATQARRDVAADVDEIIEHVINANMLSMPYDVYSELFDAVDGLGVKIENLQSENAKLRELVRQMHPRAKAFLQMGVQLGCNDTLSYDWELQMRELGVEVDG